MSESSYCVMKNDPNTVNEFISDLKERHLEAPLRYWVEPRPGFSEDCDCHDPAERSVYGRKWPLLHYPLDEARLYWRDRALQVVYEFGKGCRAVEYGEGQAVLIPDGSEEGGWSKRETQLTERIVLRKDLHRFGFPVVSSMCDSEVEIVRYTKDGILVAWRLVPVNDDM